MGIDWKDFAAGWVGGASGVLTSHALDTVKVQLQTSQTKQKPLQCFANILKREGLRGFYRGMSFPLLTVAVYNSTVFGIYSNSNRLIQQKNDGNSQRAPYYSEMMISSMFAGALSTSIGSPVDLIKIKLQAANPSCKKSSINQHQSNLLKGNSNQLLDPTKIVGMTSRKITTSKKPTITFGQTSTLISKYNGPIHCLRHVIQNEGVAGLYRGCGAMIVRDIPGYVIYFLPYFALCKLFRGHNEVETGTSGLIMAGGLAGMLSWGVMHPIDTIKSRIQASGKLEYSGFVDCVKKTVRNEGVSVLFQGLTVNALRGFPQSASLFLGYEMTIRALR